MLSIIYIIMHCGNCNRKVRKDVVIDNIRLCHVCKNEKLKELMSMFNIKYIKNCSPYLN